MLSRLHSCFFVLFGLATATAGEALAAVVLDDVAISPPSSQQIQSLDLVKSIPQGQGWFGIQVIGPSWTPASAPFNFEAIAIAEAFRFYEAAPGTTIDRNFVLSAVPIAANDMHPDPVGIVRFAVDESRYFAYWDDRTFSGAPEDGDNYGWVRITRTLLGGLEASASATAIGRGIVVGSTVQIPEPASVGLVSVGLVALAALRRRK